MVPATTLSHPRTDLVGRVAAEGLARIKEDIVAYLEQEFGAGNVRVTFTMRDRQVWGENKACWRYWAGVRWEDLNDLTTTPVEQGWLKKRVFTLLGSGEGHEDDSGPWLFVHKQDVSGNSELGKSWMAYSVPNVLADAKQGGQFEHHTAFDEATFGRAVKQFLTCIFDKEGLKKGYRNDPSDKSKARDIVTEKLNECAKISLEAAWTNKKALESSVKNFNARDAMMVGQARFWHLRYLVRAIDYYFLFQGFTLGLAYSFKFAGYQIVTFYISLSGGASSKWQIENTDRLDGKAEEGWRTEREVAALISQCFRSAEALGEEKEQKLSQILNSVDYIINIGWLNTVNSMLTSIIRVETAKGSEIDHVVEEVLSYLLFAKNSPDVREASSRDCLDFEDAKYWVDSHPEPKEQTCKNFKDCENNCLRGTVAIDARRYDRIRKQILIRYGFCNIKGLLRESKMPVSVVQKQLESLIRNTGSQYFNLVRPGRISMITSGIGAIMSRNMSHNIGSHVIAVAGRGNEEPTDTKVLLRYLQQRMDFIALTTSGFPRWTVPSYFVHDVMRRFYMQQSLLDYIARAEGLCAYEFQNPSRDNRKGALVLRLLDGAGKEVVGTDLVAPRHDLRDVLVALPGGVTGSHAFYTILENFIRNGAKHAWSKGERRENYVVTIQFKDRPERGCVEFTVFDNASDPGIASNINKHLCASFIGTEGELVRENWGMAEMKIACGYLRCRDVLDIGQPGVNILYDPEWNREGLLKAEVIDDPTDSARKVFGYRFEVPKPWEFEIVLSQDEMSALGEDAIDDARSHGIRFVNEVSPRPDVDVLVISTRDLEKIHCGGRGLETLPGRVIVCKEPSEEYKGELKKPGTRIAFLQRDTLRSLLKTTQAHETVDSQNGKQGEARWDSLKLFLWQVWVEFIVSQQVNTSGKILLWISPLEPGGGEKPMDNRAMLRLVLRKLAVQLRKKVMAKHGKDFDWDSLTEERFKNACLACSGSSLFAEPEQRIAFNRNSLAATEIRTFLGVNDAKLKDALKTALDDLCSVVSELYGRYDEHILTLPLVFRARRGANGDAEADRGAMAWSIIDQFHGEESRRFLPKCLQFVSSPEATKDENDPALRFHPVDSKESINLTEDDRVIVFRRHEDFKCSAQYFYTEALSGAQSYFPLFIRNQGEYLNTRFVLQLLETAFLRLLVLDERAASYYGAASVNARVKLDRALISIPAGVSYNGEFFPLASVENSQGEGASDTVAVNAHGASPQSAVRSHAELGQSPTAWANLQDRTSNWDILIVHQGVLDKFLPYIAKEEIEQRRMRVDAILRDLRTRIPLVIVTSGRGKPPELPESARFIPFSDIEEYLFKDNPEKFIMVNTIMKTTAGE